MASYEARYGAPTLPNERVIRDAPRRSKRLEEKRETECNTSKDEHDLPGLNGARQASTISAASTLRMSIPSSSHLSNGKGSLLLGDLQHRIRTEYVKETGCVNPAWLLI